VARTYIPSTVIQVHELAKYLSRYQATLRAAIVAVDPSAGSLFDALFTSVIAFDALNQVLYPIED